MATAASLAPAAAPTQPESVPDITELLQRLGIAALPAEAQKEWIKERGGKLMEDAAGLLLTKPERASLQTFARGDAAKPPPKKPKDRSDAAPKTAARAATGGEDGASSARAPKKDTDLAKASRWLTKGLRHNPEQLNLPEFLNAEGHPRRLERGGWAPIDRVLDAIRPSFPITREDLLEIVQTSDKQRLGVSPDGLKIRANQGHSCEVDMDYEVRSDVPSELFHGTSQKFLAAILETGLKSMSRQFVHLTLDLDTASKVGSRHTKDGAEVTILRIDATRMYADGFVFHRSENQVWLSEHVPSKYLSVLPTSSSE